MERWSRFVLAHRWLVVGAWLLVLVPALVTAPGVADRLSQQFSLPGQDGFETNLAIQARYGNGGGQLPLVAVVRPPGGQAVGQPDVDTALDRGFAAVAALPGMRVASVANTGDREFVGADGRTTFGLVFVPRQPPLGGTDVGPAITETLRDELPPGWMVAVSGMERLRLGGESEGPGVLIETIAGGLGALAVLAFVFGSLLALVPLLIAAISILTTFLIITGLTELVEVNMFVQFLVALIGLGVAIDYSLLLVTRWREELGRGAPPDEAVHRAMATAGRAVVFSGVTVAIGLAALVFLPVPFLRSMGYAGMLIPAVSSLATLTVLPVVLAGAGRRLDWPRLRTDTHAGRGWSAWALWVIRHRVVAVLGALVVLVPLGIAAFGLHLGTPRADSLATSGPAHDGLVALQRADVPTGVLTPVEVLAAGPEPDQVAARLAEVPGVRGVVAPDEPDWRRDGTAVLSVIPTDETGSDAGERTVERLRAAAESVPGVRVGGRGPEDMDFADAVYGRFPLMLGLVTLVTFVLLVRAFRSVLLPAKAVLLNLLSVGAIYGVMVLVWQKGHGSGLWDVPATGSVEVFVPLLVFAFLFGLSMDYEVFIVARMRETYDRTGSNPAAIVEGIGRTGRLVTSAALVLLLAFASLSTTPIVTAKVFATGMGAGILLDATVVRALLLPALVSLFGRWNWWLPGWAARILRVRA